MNQRLKRISLICFLIAEAILYYFVLTAGGDIFTVCAYTGIVLCFLFALLFGVKNDPLIVAGLACTVGADFCLVVCSPIQQLWGTELLRSKTLSESEKPHPFVDPDRADRRH